MTEPEGLISLLTAAMPSGDGTELARAIAVSAVAHAGQLDRTGQPYILHPMRVMVRCQADGPEAQTVGALHDVIEDTWVTLDHLRALGFAEAVVAAVDAISYRKGQESYVEYIYRCAANELAARVKLADLTDNSDPVRRFSRGDYDQMLERYRRAREIIEARLRPELGT